MKKGLDQMLKQSQNAWDYEVEEGDAPAHPLAAEKFLTKAQLQKLTGASDTTLKERWNHQIINRVWNSKRLYDNFSVKRFLFSEGKLIPGYNLGASFEEWQAVPNTRIKKLPNRDKTLLLDHIDEILTHKASDSEKLRRIVSILNTVI